MLNAQMIATSPVCYFGFCSCPDLCDDNKPQNIKVEFAFTPHGKSPDEMTAIFEWVETFLKQAGNDITIPGDIVNKAFGKAVIAVMTRGFDVWVRVCCDVCLYEKCCIYWDRLNWIHRCSGWRCCISNETLVPEGKGWKPGGTGTPPFNSWADAYKEIKKTADDITCP
jgi:hypothetical protein